MLAVASAPQNPWPHVCGGGEAAGRVCHSAAVWDRKGFYTSAAVQRLGGEVTWRFKVIIPERFQLHRALTLALRRAVRRG